MRGAGEKRIPTWRSADSNPASSLSAAGFRRKAELQTAAFRRGRRRKPKGRIRIEKEGVNMQVRAQENDWTVLPEHEWTAPHDDAVWEVGLVWLDKLPHLPLPRKCPGEGLSVHLRWN